MIIEYVPGKGLALVEADDFKSFKLRLRDTPERRPVLPGIAFVDDVNVLIDIEAATRLPGASDTDAWRSGFGKMVVYAATKGWIDAATNSIRAHVERIP